MEMDSGDEAYVGSDEADNSDSESGGDELEFEDFDHENVSRSDSDGFVFEVLEPEKIVEYMCEIIREVADVVKLPTTVCRIMLHHFRWNKEKLIETYYGAPDPEKIFSEARVVSPFHRMPHCLPSTSSRTAYVTTSFASPVQIKTLPADAYCHICCQTLPIARFTGLECGHQFCTECWETYITMKVMEEGKGQTIACAAHHCEILVDDATVMRLIKDPLVKRRYHHLITNSFVECNRLLRWCPSADCGRAVKVSHHDCRPVTCMCRFTFCFACGAEWHEPVNCRLLKMWIQKCSDDSETSNWIAANTKECPKCQVTIEKDGGCNHMTCKNTACKNEFCWVCLGPWEPHGNSWYACNRFDDSAAKSARDAQERSRAALQRYLHYCNRYMNHMQSLKFENKLYATVKGKMEQMQQQAMSWIEVQFLRDAVDVLCQCRRTLLHTYVFAYYLTRNNQSQIFEDNQRDLEMATEELSAFLEHDLDNENLCTLKQEVQDKYRYCNTRRNVLLDHCSEGNEKDWWQYNA